MKTSEDQIKFFETVNKASESVQWVSLIAGIFAWGISQKITKNFLDSSGIDADKKQFKILDCGLPALVGGSALLVTQYGLLYCLNKE